VAQLAALVTVVLWASAFVGIRAAGEDFSPGALSLGRLVLGSVLLGGFVLARRERLPVRRDLPLLFVIGVLWFGVYNVALNEAERRIDAGTAAMLINIGPILIAVLAGILLREGFPPTLVAGCAIAFTGVVVISLATSELGVDASWGAVLCVVAALAYSVAVVAQKPLLSRASGLSITWLACTIGALVCVPFLPSLADELGNADTSSVAWMVYLGVFPTSVGFMTWAYALDRTSAGRMGATTYLVPPIAILIAWAFLDETPPELALLGGALCLAGVVVARSSGWPGRDALAESARSAYRSGRRLVAPRQSPRAEARARSPERRPARREPRARR
jgi:drug/metabolite transporter (DMT)-like permease